MPHLGISHIYTCDFHRKESDSVIEARTGLRNDVTVLSLGREGKKGKGRLLFYENSLSHLASADKIIAMIADRKTARLISFYDAFRKRKELSSRLATLYPSPFSVFTRRDVRNSLKRIQMTLPLCIFMPPRAELLMLRNNYFVHSDVGVFICRRDRNTSSLPDARILNARFHLCMSEDYKILEWPVVGSDSHVTFSRKSSQIL